ncbi:hypothetical protein EOL94_03645 [bacterium]|nr:hypothetical protein [bacterium]
MSVKDVVKYDEKKFQNLSKNRNVTIREVSGKKLIFNSNDVFASSIDPDFEKLKLIQTSKPTGKVVVDVYKVLDDMNFMDMFLPFLDDIEDVIFTQHQIIVFCQRHYKFIKNDGREIFFLFKGKNKLNEDDLFVAAVFNEFMGLGVRVYDFYKEDLWSSAEHGNRIVVPRFKIINS